MLTVYTCDRLSMVPQFIMYVGQEIWHVGQWTWRVGNRICGIGSTILQFIIQHDYSLKDLVFISLMLWSVLSFINKRYRKRKNLKHGCATYCNSMNEHEIRSFFGDVKNDRLCLLIKEAIRSIERVKGKGFQELLKNTSLNIYHDENVYNFKSGNGRNLIVINYENEIPVTEFLGFPSMD